MPSNPKHKFMNLPTTHVNVTSPPYGVWANHVLFDNKSFNEVVPSAQIWNNLPIMVLHLISKRAVSSGAVAKMIPVNNDCKQTQIDHLLRSSKLFHLFGHSVTDTWRTKRIVRSHECFKLCKPQLEELTVVKFVVVKDTSVWWSFSMTYMTL